MTELIKEVGSSVIEKLIIAAIAAIATTYILTERHDARIAQLEIQEARTKQQLDRQAESCQELSRKMERVNTMVELHMQRLQKDER